MLGIANLLLDTPADPTGRIVQNAMKDYFTLHAAQDAGEGLAGRLFGSGLDREEKELDIALKKRQLEMLGPQDSQEFNDTPAPSILAALGITWAKDLQPPKGSSGFTDSGNGVLRRALARESMGDHIPFSLSKELGNVARSSGGGAGNIARRLSRFSSLF